MSNAIDKFKVDETAPLFEIAATGSYGGVNSGIKSAYRLKSKDPLTKNVVVSSGILSNGVDYIIAPTAPSAPSAPTEPTEP